MTEFSVITLLAIIAVLLYCVCALLSVIRKDLKEANDIASESRQHLVAIEDGLGFLNTNLVDWEVARRNRL